MNTLAFEDMGEDTRRAIDEADRETEIAAPPPPADTLDLKAVPRIAIQAFCESDEVAGTIERAAQDRRMAKAHVKYQRSLKSNRGMSEAAAREGAGGTRPSSNRIKKCADKTVNWTEGNWKPLLSLQTDSRRRH